MAPRQRQPRRLRAQRRTVLVVTNGRQAGKMYLDPIKQQTSREVSVTTPLINGGSRTLAKALNSTVPTCHP